MQTKNEYTMYPTRAEKWTRTFFLSLFDIFAWGRRKNTTLLNLPNFIELCYAVFYWLPAHGIALLTACPSPCWWNAILIGMRFICVHSIIRLSLPLRQSNSQFPTYYQIENWALRKCICMLSGYIKQARLHMAFTQKKNSRKKHPNIR